MKSPTLLWILLLGLCVLTPHSDAAEQSWEEFIKMKQQAETPKLIPKGGAKPRLLKKDLIIEEIRETGQFNTGATDGGKPGRPDITSEALLFEYGLPQLRDIPENQQNLRTIAQAILALSKEYPHYYVDGHTCDIGSDENNCRLSWARARTVYDRLVAEGVDPQALTMRGFGENPNTTARPNISEENRKLNRRVVLIAYGAGPGAEWSGKKTARGASSGSVKHVKGLTPKRPGKDIEVEEAPGGRGRDKEQFMCSTGPEGGFRPGAMPPPAAGTQPFLSEDPDDVSSVDDEFPDAELSPPGLGADSEDPLGEKGKRARMKKMRQSPGDAGIPAGFKPLSQPSPKSGEQPSQPQKSKEGIPRGFKALD